MRDILTTCMVSFASWMMVFAAHVVLAQRGTRHQTVPSQECLSRVASPRTRVLSEDELTQSKKLLALKPGESIDLEQSRVLSIDAQQERKFITILQTRGYEYLWLSPGKVTRFRSQFSDQWNAENISALTFADVDHNQLLDLVVIERYMTGIGPTGAQPFAQVAVFLQRTPDVFVEDTRLGQTLSESNHTRRINIQKALRFVKRYLCKK